MARPLRCRRNVYSWRSEATASGRKGIKTKGGKTMMDELIANITARTGLQPDQAKGAAEAVLEFLKARLPASVASSLDSVVSGGAGTGQAGGGVVGSAASKLGGMFGKDK